ncbi:hypothetical protein R1sor_006446 [Riccia sorocarpa]|uniref:RRM domain-containing protein n=1 Tax=Riccia sorocarpa TaxID=122646 RepID=A0ABD3HRS0_9MARC
MAARLWQACTRQLGKRSNYNGSKLLNERSCFELEGRSRAFSADIWTQSLWHNVGVRGESSGCRTLGGEGMRVQNSLGNRTWSPFTRWCSAMQNTTISFDEDTSSHRKDEESSEDKEFVPENVVTPNTPLVEAIQDADERSEDAQPQVASPSTEVGDLGEISPSEREIDPLRIYVGGLPFDFKGDQLKQALSELLSKYGTVKEVELSRHRSQSFRSIEEGKHRGFAFVSMESPDQARAAIENLNGEVYLGRTLSVSYGLKPLQVGSGPRRRTNSTERLARRKVFVGNLHEDTSVEALSNAFKQYGKVIGAKLICELNTGKSRGFGFVTFETESEAMKAILDLDGSILDGSVIRVNIAKYPQSV